LNDKKFQITKDRGRWLPGPQNTEVMVTFHPSYVMRQFGDSLAAVKQTVLDDIGLVRDRLAAINAGTAMPPPWQKPKTPEVDNNGQLSMF
jgi:hypothetical protein